MKSVWRMMRVMVVVMVVVVVVVKGRESVAAVSPGIHPAHSRVLGAGCRRAAHFRLGRVGCEPMAAPACREGEYHKSGDTYRGSGKAPGPRRCLSLGQGGEGLGLTLSTPTGRCPLAEHKSRVVRQTAWGCGSGRCCAELGRGG
ncbi:hypothetical protein E2C01_041471 [Portunus trituberculatus]|uniref:Secreted protein n=1 Tax=Portunus trituberculatus TaxID=210409 RepID=A0A5B7FQH6_PORTR|nr:hypothetical protein [Portunus trituberculatus]